MRLVARLLCGVVAVGIHTSCAAQPTDAGGRPPAGTNADVATKSVLRIRCGSKSIGTGFLHRSGKVITAAHVVSECPQSNVILTAGATTTTITSSPILDVSGDLALLTPTQALPGAALPFSARSALQLGAQVSSWGFPTGHNEQQPLLIVGHLAGESDWRGAPDGRAVKRYIINAALNEGMSGGPVIDVNDGAVIGMILERYPLVPQPMVDVIGILGRQADGPKPHTITRVDGKQESLSDTQLVAEVLKYLKNHIHSGIGYAVRVQELRHFLLANGVAP